MPPETAASFLRGKVRVKVPHRISATLFRARDVWLPLVGAGDLMLMGSPLETQQ